MKYPFLSPVLALTATLFLTAGCGDSLSGREPIPEVRELNPDEAPAVPEMSTAERLGFSQRQMPAGHPPTSGAGAPATASGQGKPSLAYEVPEGWEELPASQFRDVNLRPAGDPDAECFVTVLPGSAGGLLPNLNRWRAQMGADPISEAEAADLPRKSIAGVEGVYMEVEGAYGGMGGQESRPDYLMAAVATQHGDWSYFVKMTGPKAVVQAELDKLHAFCASLAAAEPQTTPAMQPGAAPASGALPEGHPPVPGAAPASGALPDGHPPVPGAAPASGALPEGHPPVPSSLEAAGSPVMPPAGGADNFAWDLPEGWERGPDRDMRLATLFAGPDHAVECRLFILDNMGGGLEDNVNRWRQQMGLPALGSEEIANLPRIDVLGHPSTLLDLEGSFTDMQGTPVTGQRMLGLICPLENRQGLFIKLTGPTEAVAAERDNFLALCASLRQE
jgi:hypothetical protein